MTNTFEAYDYWFYSHVLSLALALSEEIQKSESVQDTTKLINVEQKESQT